MASDQQLQTALNDVIHASKILEKTLQEFPLDRFLRFTGRNFKDLGISDKVRLAQTILELKGK